MEWLQVGTAVSLFVVWASAVLVVLAILSVGRRNDDENASSTMRGGAASGLAAGFPRPGGRGEFDDCANGLTESNAPTVFRSR